MYKRQGERCKIDFSSGVQRGDTMGPTLFCMPLLPVLKRTREEFEQRGVESFAYLDDISIGMMEMTPRRWRSCLSSNES